MLNAKPSAVPNVCAARWSMCGAWRPACIELHGTPERRGPKLLRVVNAGLRQKKRARRLGETRAITSAAAWTDTRRRRSAKGLQESHSLAGKGVGTTWPTRDSPSRYQGRPADVIAPLAQGISMLMLKALGARNGHRLWVATITGILEQLERAMACHSPSPSHSHSSSRGGQRLLFPDPLGPTMTLDLAEENVSSPPWRRSNTEYSRYGTALKSLITEVVA